MTPSSSLFPLLVSVLFASLMGSLHCAGMCGPFVTVYSAASSSEKRQVGQNVVLHAAYHGGRALTYTIVGGLGGALGSFIDLAGKAAGLARLAAFGSSVLLVLWGLGIWFPRLHIRSPWDGILGRRLVQLRKRSPWLRASLLGTLTPLLPCGWFYAFAVTAAGTGSIASGATVMAVFWLGTVPALLGVGAVMGQLAMKIRNKTPALTGAALIFIGVLGVWTRMQNPLALTAAMPDSSSTQSAPDQEKVRCH